MHADADNSGTSSLGALADRGRISWLRIFLLSGPECDRHPFAYGVALTVWLIAVGIIGGMALLAAPDVLDYGTEHALDPVTLNLTVLPPVAIFYLKVMLLLKYYLPFAVAAGILGLALLTLQADGRGLRLGRGTAHILIALVELAVLWFFSSTTPYYLVASHLLDKPWAKGIYSHREFFSLAFAAAAFVLGWLLVGIDSFIVAPKLKSARRFTLTFLVGFFLFGGMSYALLELLYRYRIDTIRNTFVTAHLLYLAPTLFIILLAVVAIPEMLRASEEAGRPSGSLVLPAALAAAVVTASLFLVTVQRRTVDPTVTKLMKQYMKVINDERKTATDVRLSFLFYPDGPVRYSQYLVNSEFEHLLRDANALPDGKIVNPYLWENQNKENLVMSLLTARYNGDSALSASKNLLRSEPGAPDDLHTFAVLYHDGWPCLSRPETDDIAALLSRSATTSVGNWIWLSGVYYWQGDYQNAWKAYERAMDQAGTAEREFGPKYEQRGGTTRWMNAAFIEVNKAWSTPADIILHDVSFRARLDGKPLNGLSVGVSAAVSGFGSEYAGKAEPLTRFVTTDANGFAEQKDIVSGPCAVAITLSTETMSFIPGNYTVVAKSINLDKKTKEPADVEIDFVPEMNVAMNPSGDSVALNWDAFPGASKYRVVGPNGVVGETADTSMTVKRDSLTRDSRWSADVFALDSSGRVVSSDLGLDSLSAGAEPFYGPERKPLGLTWRRIAPGELK